VDEPIHYQNMMLPQWTDVGIGVIAGPQGRFYTMDFGTTTWGTIVTAAPPAQPSAMPPTPAGQVAQVAPTAQVAPKIAAPPTKRPTPIPTSTPTITLTPSITYTPHATFTPTFTATGEPPTMTAIVLEISPPPPTVGITLIAAVSTAAPVGASSASTQQGDPIRTLIPIAIALQVAVVSGLVIRAAIRRGQ
jgi:hypothetical protein